MIPGLPLVSVILVAQTLNGILLPVILIFTLQMVNNPRGHGRARQRAGCATSSPGRSPDRPERDPGLAASAARWLVAAAVVLDAQEPSSRSCERGSMCTSTSALGTQPRMSAAMCSAISCASATVRSRRR